MAELVFLEAPGDNPLISSLFQLPESSHIPWLLAVSLNLCFHHLLSFSNSDLSVYWDLSDNTGPTWIVQDNLLILKILNLITSSKSTCTYHIHRFWRLGRVHLWGAIILLTLGTHLFFNYDNTIFSSLFLIKEII